MSKRTTLNTIRYLIRHEISIATAESCTAGLVAAAIGGVSGASSVFNEGFVTYSNESKEKNLGVSHDLLEEHGAVSHQVCRAMAEGVCKKTGADIGIATTGIAGPNGGSESKPVGLVYIGICFLGKTNVYKYIFSGNRNKVREKATEYAFYELEKRLKK